MSPQPQTDEAPAPAKLVSLVVPVYNEAAGIAHSLAVIDAAVAGLPYRFEIVVVNDGSRDGTLDVLERAQVSARLVVVDLSRNFGKEAALSAGLALAEGDAVIPLDADLQDPPSLIPQLLAQWEQGHEVVLARRVDRSSDGYFKRRSAAAFYAFINRLSDVPIPEDVGDFRLMDRCVVDALNRIGENRRFMKGLFAWAGFRTATVDYARPERAMGASKFNGWKLWNLALEGITSFSTLPLRIWTYLGGAIALGALAYMAYIVVRTLVHGVDAPGYASLMSAILFIGGIQLIGLGIIGEYLGRTYMEAKRRPPFVVRRIHRR